MNRTYITKASLFAGCGGSTLGYKQAGFISLGLFEYDKHALKMLNLNFPEISDRVFNEDIYKLSATLLMEKIGVIVGELDVLDSSPPCQSYSTSNTNRRENDIRNLLYPRTIDLIELVQPKVFVIENVPGIKKGATRKQWDRLISKFGRLNYKVQYQEVKAEQFGVPQARRRLIVVGVREDIQVQFNVGDLFPKPMFDETSGINVRNSLPNILGFSPGQFKDKFHYADKPMCTITKTPCAWIYDKCGIRRKPTIEELKILSGFPESFKTTGSFNQVWARIGNAVPPPITKAIGEHIKSHILTPEVLKWCDEKQNLSSFNKAA